MHNLFGDTNAVHISVDKENYTIEQVIDGETVADVLEYVQYDPKKLVRRLEIWVSKAIKDGKITPTEGKEFISNYRAGQGRCRAYVQERPHACISYAFCTGNTPLQGVGCANGQK